MGASSSVAISITGTGFNASASSNDVTFTPVSGPPVTVTATAVTTLSAATGLRRLTVVVPNGLPIGTAALSVLNKPTGEMSKGKSLEVIAIYLPDTTPAPLGANNLNVLVTGSPNTAFVAGTTRATFGAGITVNSTTVQSATSLVANISVSANRYGWDAGRGRRYQHADRAAHRRVLVDRRHPSTTRPFGLRSTTRR